MGRSAQQRHSHRLYRTRFPLRRLRKTAEGAEFLAGLRLALLFQRQNGFVGQKKKLVSRAAREELDLGIGLPVVGFKTQWQLAVFFRDLLLARGRRRVCRWPDLRRRHAVIGGLAS